MRVLGVISDLLYGGAENRLLNVARAIDPARFDYRVATFYPPSEALERSHGSMQAEFAAAGIDVINLGLPRPGRGRHPLVRRAYTASVLVAAATRLHRYLISERVDLVDAHLEAALLSVVPAARWSRVPVAVTLYGGVDATGSAALSQRIRRAAMRAADGLFTDSRRRAADLATSIRKNRPPIYVIPNGVRLPAPTRSRADVLMALGIPNDAPRVIGQVSGLVPYKGHQTFLEAARQILATQPDVYFVCVGFPRDGDGYVQMLEEQARTLGTAHRVRFRSYQGNIADVWQIIDVHVHASELDSLPNAIIEGMSLAKPAVLAAVGGVPELVEHEQTGIVVPIRDPNALAAGVLRLIKDERLANRLAQGAYQRYVERCTPEATTRQIEEAFVDIHHRRPRRPMPVRQNAYAAR